MGTAMRDSFPMTIGALLKASVVVYVRNWRPFTVMSLAALLSLCFLLATATLLVMGLGLFTLPAVGWYPDWLEIVVIIGSIAVILVVGMLPYILAKAATVMAVSQYYAEGSVAIWPCFMLAVCSVASLTLSSIVVGFFAVLCFFVFSYVIAYPLVYLTSFLVEKGLIFRDFWFDFGWYLTFLLALLPSVLIAWLFFVEGRMFTYDYSGTWGRSVGPDGSGGPSRTYLRMKTLAIGSVYTCGTVAVWCGVIVGAVIFLVFILVPILTPEATEGTPTGTTYLLVVIGELLAIGLLVSSVAALVVVTPIAWIGRTLAYVDEMKRLHGRDLDLIKDDSGAFCWAIRRRVATQGI